MNHPRLALFADCLLVGLFTAIASIPVVTAYPAFVAACATVRDRAGYWQRFAAVLRSGPFVWLAPPLAVGILALDAIAVAAGVPGGTALALLCAVAAVFLGVLGLRAAAAWRPGLTWSTIARTATRDLLADPGGSALLAVAGFAAIAIAALVPVTLLLLAGFLALAVVAVDARPAMARKEMRA